MYVALSQAETVLVVCKKKSSQKITPFKYKGRSDPAPSVVERGELRGQKSVFTQVNQHPNTGQRGAENSREG